MIDLDVHTVAESVHNQRWKRSHDWYSFKKRIVIIQRFWILVGHCSLKLTSIVSQPTSQSYNPEDSDSGWFDNTCGSWRWQQVCLNTREIALWAAALKEVQQKSYSAAEQTGHFNNESCQYFPIMPQTNTIWFHRSQEASGFSHGGLLWHRSVHVYKSLYAFMMGGFRSVHVYDF